MPNISVNHNALKLVTNLCDKADEYGVIVKKNDLGTCIVDAGIRAKGNFLAGKAITEICLGGLGEVTLSSMDLDGVELPSIYVSTDHPAIATLGSQLAGWQIKIGGYSAICSGPARALALKPKSIYSKIDYKDESPIAVAVLESSKEPSKEAITFISDSCHVTTSRLFLILVSTSSAAGFTQVSGRIVETGIHKLADLGFDPRLIIRAWGCAPIPPVHPDQIEAMGRMNDAILYGGTVNYIVNYEDDVFLQDLVKRSVSSASNQYGRRFSEIYKEADFDFYKIDPSIFAPAIVAINNAKTGKTYTAGRINTVILKQSIAYE